MTLILIAIGIFYFLAIPMLITIVILGKDADGKESNYEYWKTLENMHKNEKD